MNKIFSALWPCIKKHPILWIVGLIIPCLASLASNLILAYSMEFFTDIVTQSTFYSQFVIVMIITIVSLLVVTIIEDITRFAFTLYIIYTENGFKKDLFSTLVHAKFMELNRIKRGDIILRYNKDIQITTQLITYDLFAIVYPIIIGIGYLISIFMASMIIGIILTIFIFIVMILNVIFMYKFEKLKKDNLFLNDQYVTTIENAVRGGMTIRLINVQEFINKIIQNNSFLIKKNDLKTIRLKLVQTFSRDTLQMTSNSLIAPFACVLVAIGLLPFASVALIIQLCRVIIPITGGLGVAINNFKIDSVSFYRMKALLNIQQEDFIKGNKLAVIKYNPLLEVNDASAQYGKDKDLAKWSFKVNNGEIICLVAPSGSGKSSIVRSILGLVNYTGSIKIMNQEVSSLELNSLRDFVSLVPEHSELISGTVYDNLICVKPKASDEDIQMVLHQAYLDINILYQDVGERGEKLSGGQRQRIAIARALLKDTPLLILDEPTASLDVQSEQKVLDTICQMKECGKAIVLITHRETTSKIADRIYSIQ